MLEFRNKNVNYNSFLFEICCGFEFSCKISKYYQITAFTYENGTLRVCQMDLVSCRHTNHWKKIFYLDLFGPGPVWISIHGDMNVSLYVYLNCYISNLYGDLTP